MTDSDSVIWAFESLPSEISCLTIKVFVRYTLLEFVTRQGDLVFILVLLLIFRLRKYRRFGGFKRNYLWLRIKCITPDAISVKSCETGNAAQIPLVSVGDKTSRLNGVKRNGSRKVIMLDKATLPVE